MQTCEGLPPELSGWLSEAALPWSPASTRRAFAAAMARTKNPARALAQLDQIQRRLMARDAPRIPAQMTLTPHLTAPLDLALGTFSLRDSHRRFR